MDVENPSSRNFAPLALTWCRLTTQDRLLIIADAEMLSIARDIVVDCEPYVGEAEIINLAETKEIGPIYGLKPNDLLLVNIGIDTFIAQGWNRVFRAFNKPQDVVAKYAFIRPTINRASLLQGLATPEHLPQEIISKYCDLPLRQPLRVTGKAGTEMTVELVQPHVIPWQTVHPGDVAYLPPAELSFGIVEGSANGKIVVDVTVGELRYYADLVDPFGMVDERVTLLVQNGIIIDVQSGAMAKRLKEELWRLNENCRWVIELGIGLSAMEPSGIIGIDESIAGTCHFGIGNSIGYGGTNDVPIHLDVVVRDFQVKI